MLTVESPVCTLPTARPRRSIGLLIAGVVLQVACAFPAPAAEPVVQTQWVAMSDGVKLATDVYWPADGEGPYPTVLIRTPYGKVQGKGLAAQLCPNGFAVVAQDMRGRFDSEGRSVPVFGNEGLGEHRDGHETIDWITRQTWSDGKVAMWGGSASAIVQNMTAPGAPASLKGQFVLEAFSDYYHQFVYRGGVWQTAIFEGWAQQQGLVEGNIELFRSHPYYDDFWKQLSPERFAEKVNAPGIYIGGWYDFFSQGTLDSFKAVQERGGPQARGNSYLVMGPIAHGLFHDRLYPNATKAPIHPFLPVEFYNYWLKGEDADKVRSLKPVHYYVMGALGESGAPGNHWRSANAWPPDVSHASFYMHPDGTLASGRIPSGPGSRTYKYDPTDPVLTPGARAGFPDLGPVDLRPIESRPDVLVFTTEPLTEPTEVTGRILARLYVSSDCPDTDFAVTLTDVYPNGRSLRVVEGIRRASLREIYEKPRPLSPGKIYELEVDLWSTSLIFNKGHRIRIYIASSNTPRFEPNPNTGDPRPTSGNTRIATNTLHLSSDHPSHIVLPIPR